MSDRADQSPENSEQRAAGQRLEVSASAAGTRLDRFVAEALQLSRRRVVQAIEAGRIRVDGRRGKKGQLVAEGQSILAALEVGDPSPTPEADPPLRVIHEEPSFAVVYKESGEPTHPLAVHETGTLANRVAASFPEAASASADPREGGVAHRLDRPTSGLVVVARNRASWQLLREAFRKRRVLKEYLALVEGEVEKGMELCAPIGRERGERGKMRVVDGDGILGVEDVREAHTLVEVERRLPGWTLLRCTITTGVMHQIRVHLAHAGHPVAGDERYGGGSPAGLERLFLHAAVLGFEHPISGEELRFESELPPELARVLAAL